MIVTIALHAAILLGGSTIISANAVPASSLHVSTSATMHRDVLLHAFHQKARQLVDTTDASNVMFGNNETFCDYIEQVMSFEDVDETVTGDCTCSGNIADTLELSCSFQNLCDERGEFCGTMDINVKMSNLAGSEENIGESPEFEIKACFDVDAEWLDALCLTLYYTGLDFIVPAQCDMTYSEQECICSVDTVPLSEQFAIEVPCLKWNCSAVAPDPLKPYLADNNCELLSDPDTGDMSVNTAAALSSFSVMEEIPPEVTSELEAGSGSGSMKPLVSSVCLPFAFAKMFGL